MKHIYRVSSDPESFLWLTLSDTSDSERLEQLREAVSVMKDWEPVLAEPIIENAKDRRNELGDFPTFWSLPTVSKRASIALKDLLDGNAELLPIQNQSYFIVNVTRLVDALDEENSVLKRFPSSGSIMRIESFAFHEEALDNIPIFKLPQYKRVDVFVSQEFKDRVESANLMGFEFELIWPRK